MEDIEAGDWAALFELMAERDVWICLPWRLRVRRFGTISELVDWVNRLPGRGWYRDGVRSKAGEFLTGALGPFDSSPITETEKQEFIQAVKDCLKERNQ